MAESYLRTSHEFINNWHYSYRVNYFGGGNETQSLSLGVKFTNSLSGYKNPAHIAQIRAIESATTIASGEKARCDYDIPGSCSWSLRRTSDQKDYFGSITGSSQGLASNFLNNPLSVSGAATTAAHNQAVSKLYNQLNSFVSSAKTGEDWGEWKQTMRSLRSPLKPLRDLVTSSHYRSLRDLELWRRPVKLAEALADTHLEFAFGFQPLESSIASAMVGLQNRDVMGFYQRFFARGKAELSSNADSGVFQADPHATINLSIGSSIKYRYSKTFHGVWAEECQLPKRSIDNVLGLRPRDILPTVWNLIPYSFLVDYFVNIGDIASSVAVPWSGVKWCCGTSRLEGVYDCSYSFAFKPGSLVNLSVLDFESHPGRVRYSRSSFSRLPVADLPHPELVFTKPWALTGRQWANLAALTVSQSAKYLLMMRKAVKAEPDLPHLFIEALGTKLGRSGGPYPFHRYKR